MSTFTINGTDMLRSPERSNVMDDQTAIIIHQTEDLNYHTHIVPGDVIRSFTIEIPEQLLASTLALIGTTATIVFDSATFVGTLEIGELSNDREYFWSGQVTLREHP